MVHFSIIYREASNHYIHSCRILNLFSLFSLRNFKADVVLSFNLSKLVECFGSCWMVLLSRQRVETTYLRLHASRAAQGQWGPTLVVVSVFSLRGGTLSGCWQTGMRQISCQMVIWRGSAWGFR